MELKEELIGRARELRPMIAASAAATEKNRGPLDENIAALRDAEIFSILSPKRYGGHELHVDSMVGVVREIAAACPSTGWVTAFYIGHNWFHSVFPQASQDEVFADQPYTLMSGQIAPTMTAERVTGGYELSGQQSWSSGISHAEWVLFNGLVSDAQEPPRLFLVPRHQVEVIDTWYIAGMCGTGSRDVAVDKVFVPEHHTLPFLSFMDGSHEGASVHKGPLYALPGPAVLYFEVMPVMAGILRGAAENFVDMTQARITSYTGSGAATQPSAQMRAGRALATTEAVDDMINAAAARVVARDGTQQMTVNERAAVRMRASLVTKTARDTVNDIALGAGGKSFLNDSPIQRYFRDINVLSTHAAFEYEPTTELYGRLALGMDPGSPVV